MGVKSNLDTRSKQSQSKMSMIGVGDELSEAPGKLSQMKQLENEEEEMTEEEKIEQERRF